MQRPRNERRRNVRETREGKREEDQLRGTNVKDVHIGDGGCEAHETDHKCEVTWECKGCENKTTSDAARRHRKHATRIFDSTLGYPGEGPPATQRPTLLAINVAGMHITTDERASALQIEEAGDALIHEQTDKMSELTGIFRGQRAAVMVIADTHQTREEAENTKRLLAEEGIAMTYTPAIEREHGVTAGVAMWWDPETIRIESEDEISAGRVVRIHGVDVRTEREWTYYGVYMPVRGQSGNKEEVNNTWAALAGAVEAENSARIAVGGDLNAETEEWRQRRGTRRSTSSDKHLAAIMQDTDLVALAEDSTHHSGTQIDNWLVSTEAAAELGTTTIVPGVCGKDHDMVRTEIIVERATATAARPTNPHARLFKPESKDKLEQKMIAEYRAAAERRYV